MDAIRRHLLFLAVSLPALATLRPAMAQSPDIWSARDTDDALRFGGVVLLDIRSRGEWRETGVARGAWPVSMHETGFPERLMASLELAGDRPVALICSTGGRTGSVMEALRRAGYRGFVDVSEGMLGNRRGPGWIAAGLPVVDLDAALAEMPEALR